MQLKADVSIRSPKSAACAHGLVSLEFLCFQVTSVSRIGFELLKLTSMGGSGFIDSDIETLGWIAVKSYNF